MANGGAGKELLKAMKTTTHVREHLAVPSEGVGWLGKSPAAH
jgi:hypothetical protein